MMCARLLSPVHNDPTIDEIAASSRHTLQHKPPRIILGSIAVSIFQQRMGKRHPKPLLFTRKTEGVPTEAQLANKEFAHASRAGTDVAHHATPRSVALDGPRKEQWVELVHPGAVEADVFSRGWDTCRFSRFVAAVFSSHLAVHLASELAILRSPILIDRGGGPPHLLLVLQVGEGLVAGAELSIP